MELICTDFADFHILYENSQCPIFSIFILNMFTIYVESIYLTLGTIETALMAKYDTDNIFNTNLVYLSYLPLNNPYSPRKPCFHNKYQLLSKWQEMWPRCDIKRKFASGDYF
ncbi:hypothetical protein BpHYR1_043731 [Brachionus plicatilis]|uniref:Uncharacterized protein n=1 Tax=Brachionus plicatilis TaxID=10195 RepID=A0A3M7PJ93_BRAPC|nr:hypothetical protein BpHYR1_043731 [Brachionus plicatilis]